MSSILTNNGAMVALQTLKSINNDLTKTQNMISTGKNIASAKDNAAIWSISKVMESDVQGFKAISSSLSLGESTVAVARQASETVTDLLTQMKDKIVASQESNVDREKIQLDINALRDQITSVVGAAQFNGLNLLSNTDTAAGSGNVDVLSSLDRSANGVTASNISVAKNDLGTGASAIATGSTAVTAANNNITAGAADTAAAALTGNATTRPTTAVTIGTSASASIAAGSGFNVQISAVAGLDAGFATGGLSDIRYVARDGDTAADVAAGLAESFNDYVTNNLTDRSDIQATVAGGVLTFTGSNVVGENFSVNVSEYASADTTIGGGLESLGGISVTSDAGADSALAKIEGLIGKSIDAAASFGSSQGRIETQSEFVSKLSDALKSGIGTLVDANMEEASARLQALQVQQQLGVQSLSIANQAPQSILSLFR
ncbi:flagellin [Cognatiyoonia koreensis]|uniref:Flagellin n=1 Tax=Cognatiyoonia koreensis TaxID=364200 RepID=A0A1I0RK60_9RHOB|nr:flagellin [Cognatiyoonia koreensis]SEW41194.1 flagellin [Cognatiyoonia koreensis]